jgi:tetratricopeptide (TPR) repeat protein
MSSLFTNSIDNNDVHPQRLVRIVYLLLILTTLVVFHQLPSHDFVNLDDDLFVYENPQVQAGFTTESVLWAFTTFHPDYWRPLSWLSHMLDCQLFGLRPGLHHLINLLFHLANSALLLFILRKMTGSLWRSSFVAALFALHPLHVESVAWVAERKDVLSAFFWLLTIWAYSSYAERPGRNRYLVVLLFFALGLMTKPMVVTLPIVLLLLDFWPLGRLQTHHLAPGSDPGAAKPSAISLVWEKIPLFALSAAMVGLTLFATKEGGTLKSLDLFPLSARIGNALVTYLSYIIKMMWPQGLAVYYPHPGAFPIWQSVGAGLLLICLSVISIGAGRDRPYLAVGWLWYLITLLPVIGLIQAGSQAMADRYTYLSLIGPFIMIAWTVPSLLQGWRHRQVGLALASTIVLSSLVVCTWMQLRYWKNSLTLFQHTIDVTIDNYFAHNNLGVALARQGRLEEAIHHHSESLRIRPDQAEVHNNLANALAARGDFEEAIGHYYEALRIKPDFASAHNNLGSVLARQGKVDEAVNHYREALRIKPDYAGAHYNLGNVLVDRGNVDEAISHYTATLQLWPDWAGAHNNLGFALEKRGRLEEAISHYKEALRIRPDYAKAKDNLERALRLVIQPPTVSRVIT